MMSRRGKDMMGNSDGSYQWQGGTSVGGKEEGAVMAVAELNGTTMTMMMLV